MYWSEEKNNRVKSVLKFIMLLSLQVLLLGATGFFGTYLSEYIDTVNGFGDNGGHVEWGARRCWYNWTLIILVIIQIVRIVSWSFIVLEEDYEY